MLQATRSSVCTSRSERMPDRLDRVIAPPYHSTVWSSVSAIFRWRRHRDHSDQVSRNPSLTIHALRWQPEASMTRPYAVFSSHALLPSPFRGSSLSARRSEVRRRSSNTLHNFCCAQFLPPMRRTGAMLVAALMPNGAGRMAHNARFRRLGEQQHPPRIAGSILENTVVFLLSALRRQTRTQFSFQGTTESFFL